MIKRTLIKHFNEDKHYKIEKPALQIGKAGLNGEKNLGGAGKNKEDITLTVNCFKKLCLKAGTVKSNEIHDYYINLEQILIQSAKEETKELRNQIMVKDNQIMIKDTQLSVKDTQLLSKDKDNENNLIINFENKHIVYLIHVEEFIVKFGYAKDIKTRLGQHRTEFGKDIQLKIIFETKYNREFETMIKKNEQISKRICSKVYKKNQTELIKLDSEYTINNLINDIELLKKTLNGDLIELLIIENKELINELSVCKLKLSEYELKLTNIENHKLNKEIAMEKIEFLQEKVVKKDQYVY